MVTRRSDLVGWVERLRNPSACSLCDGFRCALPILQTSYFMIVIARREATQQSIQQPRKCGLLRFARNDRVLPATHTSAFPRPITPESCLKSSALKSEGVGNAGCPLHPQPPVQQKSTGVEATGTPGSPGIPARNGFNGFLRALPGDRALLSPSPRAVFCAKLDASVEAS